MSIDAGNSTIINGLSRRIASMLVLPAVVYFICFALLTFPWLGKFSTHYLTDDGDGLECVWNFWWVNRAIFELHESPWFTTFIHFPHGIDLTAGGINLTDSFFGLILQRFMPLMAAFNVVVIFGFVATGVTTFWLAYNFTKSYPASLIAGFIFTFCQFHFAHAQGHLFLISLYWIPLFTLFWRMQLKSGKIRYALLAAICLACAYFTNFYPFFYAVLIGAILFAHAAFQSKKDVFSRRGIICVAVFLSLLAISIGPAIYGILKLNHADPLQGIHDPLDYSMDLLSPFIYGGHWRFAWHTRFFWQKLPGNIHESSVSVGLVVLFLVVYAFSQRQRDDRASITIWAFAFVFFAVLALGPVLQIDGRQFRSIPLPYRLLEILLPPVKISGMPVRLAVMMQLSAAMLSAFAIKILLASHGKRGRWIVGILLAGIIIECIPAPLPATSPEPPAYITALQKTRGPGAVIDLASLWTRKMYYSTLYDRPIAMGYVSRTPTSVLQKDSAIKRFVEEGQFDFLLKYYGFRFLIVTPDYGDVPGTVIYRDSHVAVYDLYPAAGKTQDVNAPSH